MGYERGAVLSELLTAIIGIERRAPLIRYQDHARGGEALDRRAPRPAARALASRALGGTGSAGDQDGSAAARGAGLRRRLGGARARSGARAGAPRAGRGGGRGAVRGPACRNARRAPPPHRPGRRPHRRFAVRTRRGDQGPHRCIRPSRDRTGRAGRGSELSRARRQVRRSLQEGENGGSLLHLSGRAALAAAGSSRAPLVQATFSSEPSTLEPKRVALLTLTEVALEATEVAFELAVRVEDTGAGLVARRLQSRPLRSRDGRAAARALGGAAPRGGGRPGTARLGAAGPDRGGAPHAARVEPRRGVRAAARSAARAGRGARPAHPVRGGGGVRGAASHLCRAGSKEQPDSPPPPGERRGARGPDRRLPGTIARG